MNIIIIILANLVQFTIGLENHHQPDLPQADSPKTITVTEVLTVTHAPTPTPTRKEIFVTETVVSTIELVPTSKPKEYSQSDEILWENDGEYEGAYDEEVYHDEEEDDDEDAEKAQFGFDVDYFARRYGKISDAAGKVDLPRSQSPGVFDYDPTVHDAEDEKLEDFHKLNNKEDSASQEKGETSIILQPIAQTPEPERHRIKEADYIFDHDPTDNSHIEEEGYERSEEAEEQEEEESRAAPNQSDKDRGSSSLSRDNSVTKGKQIINDNLKNLTKLVSNPFEPIENNNSHTAENSTSRFNNILKTARNPFGLSKSEVNESSKSVVSLLIVTITVSFLTIFFLN